MIQWKVHDYIERLKFITSPGLFSFIFGSQSTISCSTLWESKLPQIRSRPSLYSSCKQNWTNGQYIQPGSQYSVEPTNECGLYYCKFISISRMRNFTFDRMKSPSHLIQSTKSECTTAFKTWKERNKSVNMTCGLNTNIFLKLNGSKMIITDV